MVYSKSSCPSEVNELNNLTDENKGQAPNPKKYIGKNTQTKSQDPDIKSKNDFKGRCSDLEGYIFDLGPRASDKFSRKMKDLDQ